MVRKALFWSLLFLFLCGLGGGAFWYWRSRGGSWRERYRAMRACRKYRHRFERRCIVKAGMTRGKGWRKLGRFKARGYLPCRRALRNESLKKAENAISTLHPLVSAYKLYMLYIAKGRRTMRIPRKLRKLYQPYFRVPLGKLRVGTSKHLKMSAITDCYIMFFRPETRMPQQLKNGVFSDESTERFFLHELAHADQCYRVGGRNNYARMWFRHLSKSVIRNILEQKKLSSQNIHKRQPMEKQAERKAIRVQMLTKNHWEQ